MAFGASRTAVLLLTEHCQQAASGLDLGAARQGLAEQALGDAEPVTLLELVASHPALGGVGDLAEHAQRRGLGENRGGLGQAAGRRVE
ncbi:MAG: hypothetical protein ABIW80_11240, partial [Lapillicoccus sp.]